MDTEEEDLIDLFKAYGEVIKCRIQLERDYGRKKGFAFVEITCENSKKKMRLIIYKISSGWVEKLELTRRSKKIVQEEIHRHNDSRNNF